MDSTRSIIKEIGTKWSNDRFGQKNRPTLAHIISGNKCDREKLIFFLQKEGVNKIDLGINSDTWSIFLSPDQDTYQKSKGEPPTQETFDLEGGQGVVD